MGDKLLIGDLRRIFGQPKHILNHAIDRFGPAPSGRIGIARIWNREDLPAIEASLRRTATRSTIQQRRDAQQQLDLNPAEVVE